MKILITGVAGFIGSNLARTLLEQGHAVVGLDNMSQGSPLNIASFRNHSQFVLHQDDIRDEQAVLRAADGCEAIVHLAAFKIPRYSDALDTLLINSMGSENVIKAGVATKARVLAASTSDIYGKNPNIPFHELSDSVIGSPTIKRWSYAVSKMFEEQLLFAYHERYGLDFVIFRFFGGYGPNQNLTWWGGPQSVFIDKALDNEEIPIHGNGQQTRSFTFVSDHVNGIIAAIMRAEANNQVFNLGNTYEITIVDLAKLIWGLTRGSEEAPKINLIPYETFGNYEDVMRRVPDISHARQVLGFEPQVDLEEGMRQTIHWQVGRRRELNIPTSDPFFAVHG